MKIFVFTYNRYDSISTSMKLEEEGIDHIVLCHSEEAKNEFLKGGRIVPKRLLATLQPKGLANNRNFALDMMEDGEWALFLVDDLINISEFDDYDLYKEENPSFPVDITNSTYWHRKLRKQISIKMFMRRAYEGMARAEREGINLVGFAGYTNPLFRGNKWKYNALADGRAWMVKKTKLRFDTNAQMIDDVAWTALNIKNGGVLINQWVLPNCSRYTKGSYGSIPERLEQRRKECLYLVQTYPSLIRFGEKKGWPTGTHIRIKTVKKHYANP